MSTLLSIGVPVYNGERFLPAALDSLLSQTFAEFELILSDNASTDGTEEIGRCYERRDPRVRYHRQAENVGAAGNFHKTLALATGKYFKWHAHDDLCAPTYLERCIEALERDPTVVLAHSLTAFIDSRGKEIRDPGALHSGIFVQSSEVVLLQRYDPQRDFESSKPETRFRQVLLHTHACFEFYGVMRLALLREARPLASYLGGDKALLAELSLRGRFVEIPEVLFFNRCHPHQGGNLSPRRQLTYMDTRISPVLKVPRRALSLRDYFRALWHADLTAVQRGWCLLTVLHWMFQFQGWKRLLVSVQQRKSAAALQRQAYQQRLRF